MLENFFLYFGVANDVEKDLDDKVVIRILYFGLCVSHLGNVNELNVLDVHSFYDSVELQ